MIINLNLSNIWHDKSSFTKDDRQKLLKLELDIRNGLHRLSVLIATMHNEVGLLPVSSLFGASVSSPCLPTSSQKPLHHYRRVVVVLQDMLDHLSGLRKIRENIPRKVTVTQVFNERREFASPFLHRTMVSLKLITYLSSHSRCPASVSLFLRVSMLSKRENLCPSFFRRHATL